MKVSDVKLRGIHYLCGLLTFLLIISSIFNLYFYNHNTTLLRENVRLMIENMELMLKNMELMGILKQGVPT